MIDSVHSPAGAKKSPAAADKAPADGSGLQASLRQLGSLAHQLHASTRAADHFLGCAAEEDRNTGSWLIACAVEMAADVAGELDGIGRSLRTGPADEAIAEHVQNLRKRAHKLHAAARAADHFIDQDHHADRETGSWLVASALGLAAKLASELDDGVAPRNAAAPKQAAVDHQDAALIRRVAAAMPVRGAA